eukprot:gnl/TRDRNA2_/TRDRNA2_172676_c3_seq1.p1 gnl/TRDRNA2_/TRDRNA2_172676_c3~~gnl/TRDRNA2_/TRDRNA2_172676_c3_seq1.p1  ORF type:complete len:407 (-),score=61.23 gnl/TRDRNA2_/TRDRNA2_172676_c3_seq1:96-1316(-)
MMTAVAINALLAALIAQTAARFIKGFAKRNVCNGCHSFFGGATAIRRLGAIHRNQKAELRRADDASPNSAKHRRRAQPIAQKSSSDGDSAWSIPPDVQDWFVSGREALLERVKTSGKHLDKAALLEAGARIRELATSADQRGVSFRGAAMHYVYFDTKFVLRGGLLYTAMHRMLASERAVWKAAKSVVEDRRGQEFCYQQQLRQRLVCTGARKRLVVASLGGGPGTDASGLLWANEHFLRYKGEGSVLCRLFDKETSWKTYTATLQQLMSPTVTICSYQCDISRSLHDACNHRALAATSDTQLWVFSYVAHETSRVAAAADWVFYRDLAMAALPGSVFLFLDVLTHAAECFDAIALAMNDALESCDNRSVVPDTFVRLIPHAFDEQLKASIMILYRRDYQAPEDAS